MDLDLLVFAAHPDDAELAAGGLIARSVKRGRRVGIVDFTRGELGSRGTPETRAEESAAADQELLISARINLGLPDGGLTESMEARRLVVEAIRRFRPALVAAPWTEDLHPDHVAAGRVVAAAFYPSGFVNFEPGSAPHRPLGLVHYMNHTPFPPSFVLDVSDVWEKRMAAVRCYASQLYNPDSDGPVTNISSPDFLERFEARYRHYGSLIGVAYGEPYHTSGPVPLADPVGTWRDARGTDEESAG